jgi:hypothetical protein
MNRLDELVAAARDLTPEEALKALAESPRRWGTAWYGQVPEIEYEGKWRRLCRTDVFDDVCTGRRHEDGESLDQAVDYYAKRVGYGVRLREANGSVFAVLDALSDG